MNGAAGKNVVVLGFRGGGAAIVTAFRSFVLAACIVVSRLCRRFTLPRITGQQRILSTGLSSSRVVAVDLYNRLLNISSRGT